ncbi:MAG: dihydroneopterin triphosphate 2'-epimerase, partial [Candidatus Portiera sp.]|nr:dihydroneopterin triphosphate 2'-epimerase [Portiera sp.]
AAILAIALEAPLAIAAKVKVEKPGALRFSDSVGVSISGSND